ncbi:hypothetical protein [Mycobacterium decipiens]|nr:hypothetical protein [Mycobacterium decipiens]
MARPTDITWSLRIVSAFEWDERDPLHSAKSAELAIALKLPGWLPPVHT